jgi:hypothetical protein
MLYISEIYLYGIVYGIDQDVLLDLFKCFTFQKYICICLCMEMRIYLCMETEFLDDLVMGWCCQNFSKTCRIYISPHGLTFSS